MSDLISRAEAMDASEKFIKDCNPDHFVGHQKFIEYMDNAEIGSFGKWQFANGFNMGLTAAEVAIKKLPSAQRTGKWIPCAKSGLILTEQMRKEGIRWYGFKCSVCGFIRKGNAPREANYCECCGARMDEDHARVHY